MGMLAIDLRAMVDTQLWSLAKKKPVKSRFPSDDQFKNALDIHLKAVEFFRNEFPGLRVYMSYQELAEIFHVLAFRGLRIRTDEAYKIVLSIIEDPGIVKVPVTADVFRSAVEASVKTKIHIWDFLCFLPVKDFIDVIYTADEHFKIIGEMYEVKVVNPVDSWLKT